MDLFLAFGVGMVVPLVILAGIPASRSRKALGFLARHRLTVQRVAGLGMLAVAKYYLVLFILPRISGFPLQYL